MIVMLGSYSNDEFPKIIVIGKWRCISFSSPSSVVLIFTQISFLSSYYNMTSLKFLVLVSIFSCYIYCFSQIGLCGIGKRIYHFLETIQIFASHCYSSILCQFLLTKTHLNSISVFVQDRFNSIKITCTSILYSFLMFSLNHHNYFNLFIKEIPWNESKGRYTILQIKWYRVLYLIRVQ